MFAAGRPVTATDWTLFGKRDRAWVRVQPRDDMASSLSLVQSAFHGVRHHEFESLRVRHGTTTMTVGRLALFSMRGINQGIS
jgi:hypothetical protein